MQESVNNIIKHSEATEAFVKITRGENDLRLSVLDNGKGFDTNSLTRKKARQSGFGLAGISERARILGGKLADNSSPENGTTINLIINY